MQTCHPPEVAALAATLRSTLPAMPDGVPRALVQLALAVLADTEARTSRVATPETYALHAKPKPLTTAELAAALSREQSTIRRRLCDTGSYFGLTPTKLPSGRLLWPADSLEQLTAAGSAK
ncbi:hypothetical protein AWB68_05006 [Caballeronia choica]|uniref:DNA-binding protein n=1 Tax=Caballeronia choica TaxID=326476 RepID=A0A158K726_9BURK|nr:hypothetical protein [Caballeronia choica]SAL76533.1 hypothetical protein AWB68_05006 [Caballeronia choica]